MIGMIGAGNMAKAMIGGMLKKGVCKPEDIIVSSKTEATRNAIQEEYQVQIAQNNQAVAQEADILFFAVKPYLYEEVMTEVKEDIRENAILVSIAPGKTLEFLEGLVGTDKKIVRTMPNTPAMVLEGMTAVCFNTNMGTEDQKRILDILGSCGKAEVVPEKLMDVVVSVSGSSPAYVFMFIEAMADAAVADGMPRKQAYRFAAQSVLGSAKMVLETGMHPGELKDMVCSPGGTTIEAVRVLEEKGMRSAVIEAMKACTKKAR